MRASGWRMLVGPEGYPYGLEKNGSGKDEIDRSSDDSECTELRVTLFQRDWV